MCLLCSARACPAVCGAAARCSIASTACGAAPLRLLIVRAALAVCEEPRCGPAAFCTCAALRTRRARRVKSAALTTRAGVAWRQPLCEGRLSSFFSAPRASRASRDGWRSPRPRTDGGRDRAVSEAPNREAAPASARPPRRAPGCPAPPTRRAEAVRAPDRPHCAASAAD